MIFKFVTPKKVQFVTSDVRSLENIVIRTIKR